MKKFAFCLLFAMWFATGIVMHFVPYPTLTEAERVAINQALTGSSSYTALNLPFNVYLMTAYFRSVPDELMMMTSRPASLCSSMRSTASS